MSRPRGWCERVGRGGLTSCELSALPDLGPPPEIAFNKCPQRGTRLQKIVRRLAGGRSLDCGPTVGTKIQPLLNTDGAAFGDLSPVASALEKLSNSDRLTFRDDNAGEIATSTVTRLLVVAGPGAGKSRLFLARISHWLGLGGSGKIRVVSFVRKLVDDLRTGISEGIKPEQRSRIEVSTLHTLARSIIERSKGTSMNRFGPLVRVIDSYWASVIWDDVLEFHPELRDLHHLSDLQGQFRTEQYGDSPAWTLLHKTYRRLCLFYNAVGFEYLIVLAREAVDENHDLIDADLWIVDEYQDFNPSEDRLVRSLTSHCSGVLLAGDDDQAIYQELKDSRPDIIAGYYGDESYANAMLPFCSRSSYFICLAASSFISKHRANSGISKIYLPLTVDDKATRVQVVAAARPSSALAYIRKFLDDTKEQFAAHMEARKAGTETEPFLLILTPGGSKWLIKCGYDELQSLIDEYADPPFVPSTDYVLVVAYARAGWREDDNFAVRKILSFEGLASSEVHDLVTEASKRPSPLIVVVGDARPEVRERIHRVAAAVSDNAEDVDKMVSTLMNLLRLDDPKALALELKANPIRKSTRIDDHEEPVPTGGTQPPIAQMTIWASKGLSAHNVMVLGCDNVNMRASDLAFFVALTRARKSLRLIVAFHSGGATQAHKFVFDLPEFCCDYVVFKRQTGSRATLVRRRDFDDALRNGNGPRPLMPNPRNAPPTCASDTRRLSETAPDGNKPLQTHCYERVFEMSITPTQNSRSITRSADLYVRNGFWTSTISRRKMSRSPWWITNAPAIETLASLGLAVER